MAVEEVREHNNYNNYNHHNMNNHHHHHHHHHHSHHSQLPFERQYKVGHKVGEGGFGRVYAGIRIRDNLPVAIKQVAKLKVPAWGTVSSTNNLNLNFLAYIGYFLNLWNILFVFKFPYR